VLVNTLGPTFISKTMDINHRSCLPSYKLLNDPSKITSLHFTIQIKKDMLVELCANNYAKYDDIMNGVNNNFKTWTTYYDKTTIWIMFQNFKMEHWQEKKIVIIITTLNQNGH